MNGDYTSLTLTTAIAIGCTVWVIASRWRGSAESNWPMFYYLGVVLYSYVFENVVDPNWIYVGVITALLLRFEFMGGFFLKVMRGFEYVVLFVFLFSLSAAFQP